MIVTSPGISKLKGNGTLIWLNNLDTPANCLLDIKDSCTHAERSAMVLKRSRIAQLEVYRAMKERRNEYRTNLILSRKAEYNIPIGIHLSWGFDNNAFDEYFGEIDENQLPHGYGVRWYSDGSIYIGGWAEGRQHCNESGLMIRPNGAQYEGSWVHGFKHGKGRQTYPDGVVYSGEFAKGLEHGKGEKFFRDGSRFEGALMFRVNHYN